MDDDFEGSAVVVQGLKEFRKAVLALQNNKDFAEAMKRVAQVVVDDVKPTVPHVDGYLRNSYRARAAGAGARIVWGGGNAIYAPWMEFGGRKHGDLVGKTTGRKQPVDRTRIDQGRYLYPAIERNRDRIEEEVLKEMNTLIRRYGFEVDGG